MTAKRLDTLLNPSKDGNLSDLIRRARDMGELVDRLRQALPAEMGASVVAANIRGDGTLVVLVTSPAWASRLRFETESLLRAAKEFEPRVGRCQVRVAHGDADR